jgi:gliding motility-associated-like protein
LGNSIVDAQCVRVRDPRNNSWTFTPSKAFRCLAPGQNPSSLLTITFESPVSNININWGDGQTENVVGPVTTVTHLYTTTSTGTAFQYTITQSGCNQIIRGLFVNDYNTTCPGFGWIFPPVDTARCLPDSLFIRNMSPGMNGFTEFLINWGDNSKIDTVDQTSAGKLIGHQYKAGTKLCNAIVRVNYRNICNVIPCGTPVNGSAGPYRFMEKDSALLDKDKIYICEPTNVTLQDASKLNCRDTSGRRIMWVAREGFNLPLPNPGNGVYRTYNQNANKKLEIPASRFTVVPQDSTWKAVMYLRNKCGEDSAIVEIKLVPVFDPILTVLNDGACLGTPFNFRNTTPNPYLVQSYEWDFGDGSPTLSTVAEYVSHTYTISGNITVTLRTVFKGPNGQTCVKSTSRQIFVKPAVVPLLKFDNNTGCDSLTTRVKNISRSTENAQWRGWVLNPDSIHSGNSFIPGPSTSNQNVFRVLMQMPSDSSALVQFRQYGMYILKLKAQSPGCDEFYGKDTVRIFPSPRLRWGLSSTNVCRGEHLIVTDSSGITETLARGLPTGWNASRWTLRFGTDTTYSSSAPVVPNNQGKLPVRVRSHIFTSVGQHWVVLKVWNNTGCIVADSFLVTVKPSAAPVLSFTNLGCNFSEIVLKNNTLGNAARYVYNVFRGNGIITNEPVETIVRSDKEDVPVFLPYAPPGDSTTYFITLTAITYFNGDSCVTTSTPLMINVFPTPSADFAIQPTADGCSPLSNVTLLNTSKNIPQGATFTYNWQIGSIGTYQGVAPPPVTFVNNSNVNKRDTITLTLVAPNGCEYAISRVLVTYPTPKASILIPDSICSGASVLLNVADTGAVSHIWQFPDFDGTAISQRTPSKVFTNLTTAPRFYTIRLTVGSAAGCSTVVERTLKVNPNPDFTALLNTEQDANCGALNIKGIHVSFANTQQFVWKLNGIDSSAITPLDTFVRTIANESGAPRTEQLLVKAVSPSGCTASQTLTAVNNPFVKARFLVTVDSGCSPLRVRFTDSSTVAANVRNWIINGVQIGSQAIFERVFFNNSLNDTLIKVQLAVRNNTGFNCRDTATRFIRVYPQPRTTSFVATPPVGCSPVTVAFSGNAQNAIRYLWNFGDGFFDTTATANVSHEFESSNPNLDRIYTVIRQAVSDKGCRDTSRLNITVKPHTKAVITHLGVEGCTPFTAHFNGGNSINANAFTWNFGDGSPDLNNVVASRTFQNSSDTVQIYRVRLVARKLQVSECPDTAYVNVTVYPIPKPALTTSTNAGCGPLPVTINNVNNLPGNTVIWAITSGGLSDTIYNRPSGFDTVLRNSDFGPKEVYFRLMVRNTHGCTGSTQAVVVVSPNLTAAFSVDTVGCTPRRLVFNNQSQNLNGTFLWNFGDGNTSTLKSPTHTYIYAGGRDTTFKVTLTATTPIGNCSRKDSTIIRVFGRPDANFWFGSDSSIQLPENRIVLINRTHHRDSWLYTWQFGDGGSSTSSEPSFEYVYNLGFEDFTDTIFKVRMIATHPRGCADTIVKSMVIKPGKPVADFDAFPVSGCAPLDVQLISRSKYASRFEYSFVDLTGSQPIIVTERDPLITFFRGGFKTIKLKVRGLGGVDSIEKSNIIEVFEQPRASFRVDPAPPKTVVAPEEPITVTPVFNNPNFTYTWYFGDGTSLEGRTVQHRYQKPGTYDIVLKVETPQGCVQIDTVKSAAIARAEQIILVPTAFRPTPFGSAGGFVGGDNDNNIFYPYAEGLSKINIKVYNRWGQLVFESNQLNFGWDGYNGGKLCKADAYVYRIEATFSNGETKILIGDVTLLR